MSRCTSSSRPASPRGSTPTSASRAAPACVPFHRAAATSSARTPARPHARTPARGAPCEPHVRRCAFPWQDSVAALVDWASLLFFFGSCVSYLVIIGAAAGSKAPWLATAHAATPLLQRPARLLRAALCAREEHPSTLAAWLPNRGWSGAPVLAQSRRFDCLWPCRHHRRGHFLRRPRALLGEVRRLHVPVAPPSEALLPGAPPTSPLRSGPSPTPTQAPTQPGRRSQALLLSSLSPSYHPSRRFSSLHYYRAIIPSILPI